MKGKYSLTDRIKNKLKSRKGVSILFALLAFMVAAMVAITIITAATSMIKRVHSDKAEEQTHLTLTSAAQLVETELESSTYTVETTTSRKKTTTTKTAAGTFGAEMGTLVDEINAAFSSEDITVWQPNRFQLSSAGFENVQVSVQMDQAYNVIFVFSLDDIEHDEASTALYLSMNGNRDTSQAQKCIYSWNKGTISGVKPKDLKEGENG